MVELGSAHGREDTGLVMLERGLVGFDGNRDGTLSDGGSHLGVAVRSDILESGDDTNIVLLLGVVANSVSHLVWVVGFRIETAVLDDVLEGVVHETAIATLVSFGSGAIHELLFRETVGSSWHGSGGDLDASFGGSSCGERPARSALSLVLDWSDSSLGAPVNTVGLSVEVVNFWEFDNIKTAVGHHFSSSELEVGLEFFVGHARVFVDTHVEGFFSVGVSKVVGFDHGNVFGVGLFH